MKKKLLVIMLVLALVFALAACGGGGTSTNEPADETDMNLDFKVGMVTDAGTIDDKSFNQGTWEGVLRAAEELGIESKYLRPTGTTEADYVKEISNLYDAGFRVIVTPGFKFETAIFQAQAKYPDAMFVLIDGTPHKGDYASVVAENTVSIFYAEEQSGFLAGVATALELGDAELGFIGGMEIPPVQKFNWGFQQGVAYANENLGTACVLKAENVLYEGSFDNVAAGQQIAAGMFDKGVKAIFCAAGGVGVGAINEAKSRAAAGKEAWVIGVDVDQYADGIYDEASGKSIILTSAMKCIDVSAYDMIFAYAQGSFPGGMTLLFDAANDGIGIPDENPNLSAGTITAVADVFEKVKAGDITIAAEQGSLIK